jgi:DNA-binding NarL/FixJ family response regulator
MEVLALLGEGLLKKEIADRLQISYATVDEHVAHIYGRLGVRNAPAAVNKAHRLGLFPRTGHDHSQASS